MTPTASPGSPMGQPIVAIRSLSSQLPGLTSQGRVGPVIAGISWVDQVELLDAAAADWALSGRGRRFVGELAEG